MAKEEKVEVVLGGAETDVVIADDNAAIMADQVVDETQDDVFVLPKNAHLNSDGTVTLTLRRAISVQIKDQSGHTRTDTYDKLNFNYLTGGDLRAINSTSQDMQMVVTFARSTKIKQTVMNVLFDKLLAPDVNDGAEIISAFMNGGRLKK